mgnify:CR=1 FL=1
MIGWKLIYLAVAAAIYIILIILFFNFENDALNCSYEKPCVRFCQSDRNLINDKDLEQKFKNSKLYRYSYDFESRKSLTIYRKQLKCKEINYLYRGDLRAVI